MTRLADIPELAALRSGAQIVRIPPDADVPTTPRVRRLIETPQFQRLAGVSQLGLVRTVYPGATHSRFEHSLGAYRTALLFLDRLSTQQAFREVVDPRDGELFLAAALLHDVAHWPYCHPIEDLDLPGVPEHETLAAGLLAAEPLAAALEEDWGLQAAEVSALLAGERGDPAGSILGSMLSGPIDIDKIDYLTRDSLHAGVPYGRHLDVPRLVQSLCLNEAGNGLAITDKGKTAAESMVFARYVMFSEVYWHKTVRSATAMLQRLVYNLADRLPWDDVFRSTDASLPPILAGLIEDPDNRVLYDGLFGGRVLYKCVGQYSLFESPDVYSRLRRRSYSDLAACSEALASLVAEHTGMKASATDVLIDAPPAGLEVQFNTEVYYRSEDAYLPLGEVSPMVRALAKEQFDDYVKRVRVFVHPRIAEAFGADGPDKALVAKMLGEAVDLSEQA
ncbi:MAG: HD domain-containing protein [Planctomycetota bacterium]